MTDSAEKPESRRSPVDGSVEGLIMRLTGIMCIVGCSFLEYPWPMGMMLWALFTAVGVAADRLKLERLRISLLLPPE